MANLRPPRRDTRKYPRIKTNLRGRYMLADRSEHQCKVVDVAVGGVALTGPEKGEVGEPVIVYMDELGRVEGEIVRHLDGGFALRLTISPYAAEKLARRLGSLKDYEKSRSGMERRNEPRIRLDGDTAAFSEGTECEIVDLSLTGADVKVRKRPPIGTVVQLGHVRGKVVRHSETGIAIEFLDITDDTTLTEQIEKLELRPRTPP